MTYSESWPEMVSKAEMLRELKKHGSDPQELYADLGEHDEYQSDAVLGWLGY